MTHLPSTAGLHSLARMHGIQTSYFNVQGVRVRAAEATLKALLGSLGVAANCAADCNESRRQTALRQSSRPLEPVIIAWDGMLPPFEARTLGNDSPPRLFTITTEGGTTMRVDSRNIRMEELRAKHVGSSTIRTHRIDTGIHLPFGYHTLSVDSDEPQGKSLIISAPTRSYRKEPDGSDRWGCFAPLYALRTKQDWGAGTYTSLETLAGWIHNQGGGLLGTLPLLPSFHEEHGGSSPYLPVTRLLWGEFYIDVEDIPFVNECPDARALLESTAFQEECRGLRGSSLVDYNRVENLKEQILAPLALHVRAQDGTAHRELKRFLHTHPLVSDYAAFRAAIVQEGKASWHEWPERMRNGDIRPADFDAATKHYYEFVQWIAHEQMTQCVERASEKDVGLYLDLPVGVHPDGYDAWRQKDCFLKGVSCGAPPDSVFTTGQDWGAPPFHPEAIRETGYEYIRACLSHHMRNAQALRIDHIMGLHHLFCIPPGGQASEGTYVKYHPEETYAIISLESHRHHTAVIGEDLGTVPREIPRAMAHHGISRMFVLYYEMDSFARGISPTIPANCMASMGTHDMPPFASFWNDLDIRQQQELGILASADAPSARQRRAQARHMLTTMLGTLCQSGQSRMDTLQVLRCILGWMGDSRARYVMVNLEDLWLETEQPNVPGIGTRYPSWRQKAALSLEEIVSTPEVATALKDLKLTPVAGTVKKEVSI
ncbi:MAG: 4-alpha-glucanotransferase [Dehalococcoidia bacterium]|nr:4-alpha-glucanotransferase [Dehalococcoidia bacterium]